MLKCSESLPVSNLLSSTAAKADFDSVVDDTTFLLSLEATWDIEGRTAGEGPLVVGVAHSDYTAAEIEEWFQATGSWDRADKIAQERQTRKIRQVGIFAGGGTLESLNDGKPVKTTLKFNVEDGSTLAQWALSLDSSQLTTGAVVHTNGKVWARR